MKSKSLQMFGLLAVAMMHPEEQQRLMEYENRNSEKHINHKKVEVKQKPPSGTKEYFFNSTGEFSTEKMLRSEVVFTCCASNDKNAVRKFNNYIKQHPSIK